MKEFHALLIEENSTSEVASLEFLASNKKEACRIIHEFAAAYHWPTSLEFIYHKHREITLDNSSFNIKNS